MPMKIKGDLRRLRSLRKQYPQALGRAMTLEAEDIIGTSAEEEVPVASGYLQSTADVVKEGPFERKIGYGTDYALVVHEDLEAHHPVGKAKYLEDPFNRAKDGMTERLVQRVHKIVGL